MTELPLVNYDKSTDYERFREPFFGASEYRLRGFLRTIFSREGESSYWDI